MRHISTFSMLALTVLVLALHLPALYDRLAVDWVEKTHLFYSPTLKDFIYTETTAGYDPQAASKAEDHHADVAYKDVRGNYYDRIEFESHLPFIYVRNMERRGLLPLHIDGRELDRETIDAHRQVLELSARNLPGHTPPQKFWPLLDANPAQAGLVFPDDRFRMTASAMEFINADYNRIDEELTAAWTDALKAAGFQFPARLVAGNFTILKPFDDGVFIVDDQYAVFHLKRKEGQPIVVRTPIEPALKCRHLTVVESNLRQFHGLMLDGQNHLHLVTADDYKLIELPMPGYDPANMDFKIIFDPMYKTAVYSDDRLIKAVALDEDYRPIASHEHLMSRAVPGTAQKIGEMVFPFRLVMIFENSRMMAPALKLSPTFLPGVLGGGVVACLIFYLVFYLRHQRRPRPLSLIFVFLTGVYGLIAGLVILDE
ncbi:DUF4857 domain-containing protein [Deltaproteobacteria bacterium OttesenSCG-928-K17]|nr:DUF4857 domain-containing protein [Deltaproteobacteria bacterium OttesenSCG-928-K17]